MNPEFKRMMELAGLTEIKINQPSYGIVKFLNTNKNAIFDVVGAKYSATDDEINNAKNYLEFEPNYDGIATTYSLTQNQNSGLNYWDFGVFSSLFVSSDKKQFIDQILYDFNLDREEDIDWYDEDIDKITPLNIGGKTIYYTTIDY
jgi:hypothetical protein